MFPKAKNKGGNKQGKCKNHKKDRERNHPKNEGKKIIAKTITIHQLTSTSCARYLGGYKNGGLRYCARCGVMFYVDPPLYVFRCPYCNQCLRCTPLDKNKDKNRKL